jgi:hypothetical protein
MSSPLIIIVSLAYLWTSGEWLWKNDYGYGIMFFSYALANGGFLLHLSRQ